MLPILCIFYILLELLETKRNCKRYRGYATALKFSMQHIYDAKEGDVFWAASDVGWVV